MASFETRPHRINTLRAQLSNSGSPEADEGEPSNGDPDELPEMAEDEDGVDAGWGGLLRPEYSTEQGG